MAALMDHVPFAPVFKEDNVFSVTESFSTESLILSCRARTVTVIKINDQKPVYSWSLKHGLELTSPVVWNTTAEKLITVFNNQDIKVWEKDCADLDKVKRKHTVVRVHQVLTVPDHDAIILCKNGSVAFLSDYKQLADSGPVKEGEEIIWCTAAKTEDDLVVALVTVSETGIKLYCQCWKDEVWQTDVTILKQPSNTDTICSCDSLVDKETLKVFILWSNGDIATVQIEDRSMSPPQVQQTFSGIHGNCCMKVIDTTHVAVAGVANKEEEGIAIFDLKFGVSQSWRPYPDKLTQKPKLFYVAGHLFLPCRTMLYMYSVSCQPSTIASLLGQTSISANQHNMPAQYRWMAGKKRDSSPQKSSNLSNLFTAALNDKITYPKFQSAFQNLTAALSKPENSHWLMSGHMVQLLQRCIEEKKFWPSTELKQLIDLKCVPPGLMSDTLDALILHSEVALINDMITTQTDIPEKYLCSALTFYLQCEDEKLASALESIVSCDMDDDDDTEADTGQGDNPCPFSSHKSFLVNKILLSSYSDVFLLECLKDVNFKHALKLLEYLCHLLSSNVSSENTKSSGVDLADVVDWLCLVLDSHMTQFILSPDAHVTLIKLHCVVSSQVQFYDGLVSLEAILDQLKAKSELKLDKKIGQYCIEVLHMP